MKIGKFEINVVDTGIFALDGGSMFGVVPKVMWSKQYNKGDELNRIPLAARPLLIKFDDRIILIDTGNGNKFNDKFASIYQIDREKSSISNALSKFGLKPEDITDVLLTHLHFDHAGGATELVNGIIQPTFHNAKYYVQKTHYEWAKNPTEKDRASFISDNFVPLFNDGLLELIDGDVEIFPGIYAITFNGHTKGMQAFLLKDESQSVFYPADFCPTAAHVPVPYVMGYDNEPLEAIKERKRILPQAYEEGWIIIYEHDAFTEASIINMNDKGFYSDGFFNITE